MKAIINSKWIARLSPIAAAAVIIGVVWLQPPSSNAEVAEIVVYKTPTCGCCVKWIESLQDSGLNVRAVDVPSTVPVRERFGVPHRLGSCHTAVFGDYWVEGLLLEEPIVDEW